MSTPLWALIKCRVTVFDEFSGKHYWEDFGYHYRSLKGKTLEELELIFNASILDSMNRLLRTVKAPTGEGGIEIEGAPDFETYWYVVDDEAHKRMDVQSLKEGLSFLNFENF